MDELDAICRHLRGGGGLSLFLDYDGTLVPLGHLSSQALPNAALLHLLTALARVPAIQAIVLSGRTLFSLAALLPVPGLALAGIYGLEVQTEGRKLARGPAPALIRPTIAQVKAAWEQTVGRRRGIVIEDKGLAVALHTEGAEPAAADGVRRAARAAVADWLPAESYRTLVGDNYLEVVPAAADKAQAVDWFLDQAHRPDLLPVYFGDDANDDEAFASVQRHNGIPIGVGARHIFRHARGHVDSPAVVSEWLRTILRAAH